MRMEFRGSSRISPVRKVEKQGLEITLFISFEELEKRNTKDLQDAIARISERALVLGKTVRMSEKERN